MLQQKRRGVGEKNQATRKWENCTSYPFSYMDLDLPLRLKCDRDVAYVPGAWFEHNVFAENVI